MKLVTTALILVSLTLFAGACTNDEGIYLLRIDNQRNEVVNVAFGETNLGEVQANVLTDYIEVEPGPASLIVNGEVLNADLELGQNLDGENYWTYTLQDVAHGLSADDAPVQMLTSDEQESEQSELVY